MTKTNRIKNLETWLARASAYTGCGDWSAKPDEAARAAVQALLLFYREVKELVDSDSPYWYELGHVPIDMTHLVRQLFSDPRISAALNGDISYKFEG